MLATSIVHPFEAGGLGQAPFRCVGMFEKVYGPQNQPAGTCDFCCNGIKYCYQIQSADGKRFIVGCDCVRKLDRADNRLIGEVEKIERQHAAKMRAERKSKREAPQWARIDAARELLPSKLAALQSQPHPIEAMASSGSTLADYVDYLNRWAGLSGLLRMAQIIEKAGVA